MGFRFRKTIRLLPGVRLNLSRGGLSTTLGQRGLSLNLGRRGATGTVGVPGTGLSYSHRFGRGKGVATGSGPTAGGSARGIGWVLMIGVLLLAMLLGRCVSGGNETDAVPTAPAKAAARPELAYVTASRLNCRAAPDAASPKVTGLSRGDGAEILDRAGAWVRLQVNGTACWAASDYLAPSPPVDPLPAPVLASRSAVISPPAPAAEADGDCPCTGGEVCIGRRGGRYCITTGGNKRYGV